MADSTASTATTEPLVKTMLDPTETSMGITSYRSADIPGFSAVLKGRYSDFIVHEVGTNGDLAVLTTLDATIEGHTPKDPVPDDRKRKRDTQEETPLKNPLTDPPKESLTDESEEPDWELLKAELIPLIDGEEDSISSEQRAENVKIFLEQDPDPSLMFMSVRASSDKQKRKALHEWIRSRLAKLALADTSEVDGVKVVRLWKTCFAKYMPNFGKFPRAPRDKPPKKFLRCVLYKENLDTNSALHQLQRRCGGGRGRGNIRLGFAGMKDKRGVTAQFITMPGKTSVERLIKSINPKEDMSQKTGGGHTDAAGVAVMRIGNFEYVDEDLRLGRLQGNRFDVVLRNVIMDQASDRSETKEILEKAASALGTAGFVNYFGVQRFGKYYDTHLIGTAILKKNYDKAVDLILQPKPDEREITANARKAWQERFSKLEDADAEKKAAAEKECARKIVRDFGRFNHNEVAILESLARHPLDYRRAIGSVSKTMRMMFVHALQSYLWNHAATCRIRELGEEVVEGDLVLEHPMENFNPGIPKVRLVTAEDVDAQRYSLPDIFLPLIGSKTIDPENQAAVVFTTLLEEQGLTRKSFDIKDRDFNCAGDYRRMIVRPAGVDFDLIEYTDPRQPLVQTDLMKLQNIEIETCSDPSKNPLLAMRIGFTLPSSAYATVALRELMKRPTSADYQKDLSLE
jgi:tRNA pseudouridine13 synthase